MALPIGDINQSYADNYRLSDGGLKPIFAVNYADTTTAALPPTGAAFSPDGTPLADNETVLFTNFAIRFGVNGRGVYRAHVVAGKVVAWYRVVFGQSPIGDSIDGDIVEVAEGATYNDYTFRCIDNLADWTGVPGVSGKITILTLTGTNPSGFTYDVTTNGANYTKSGANGDIDTSAANFNVNTGKVIYLNGIYQHKGTDVIWQTQTTFILNANVDALNEVIILS